MVEIVVPLALFISLVVGTIGVTRIISDGRTRRRLLESNASPDLAAALVASPRSEIAFGEPLKWGLVLGTVGLALILVQFLPYDNDDPIVTGILMLSASIGLLGYYLAARRMSRSGGMPRASAGRESIVG
jgi:peptidoglycan/LPS O-acetylase OafA/YrhL